MHARRVFPCAVLWLGLAVPFALGQHGGGGMGGGMHGGGFPGGPGGPGGPGMGDMSHRGGPPPEGPESAGTLRGGLQLGPPGRWWDDKHFAKDLKLRPDQQRRMDSIFEGSRATLVTRFQSLQQEEEHMQTLVHSPLLDENAIFMQIDRVEQARADLEKASVHYLLQIRGEMTADQLSRLEQHH